MAGLTLPEATSEPLRETQAGLLFRVLARAARDERWHDWDAHLEAERSAGRATAADEVSWLAALRGEAEVAARAQVAVTFCQGLGHYLEALQPQERVRSAGRVAKLLHEVSAHTGLEPFAELGESPAQDQASIWDAVLRVLLSQAQGDGLDPSWLAHLRALPPALEARWRDLLATLSLSSAALERIDQALRPPEPTVEDETTEELATTTALDEDGAQPADDEREMEDTFDTAAADVEPAADAEVSAVDTGRGGHRGLTYLGEPVAEVVIEMVEVEGIEVSAVDVPPEALPDPLLEAALEHDVAGALDAALNRALSGTYLAVSSSAPHPSSTSPDEPDLYPAEERFDEGDDEADAAAPGEPPPEAAAAEAEEAETPPEAEAAEADELSERLDDAPLDDGALRDAEGLAEPVARDVDEADALEADRDDADRSTAELDDDALDTPRDGSESATDPVGPLVLAGGFAGKPLPRALRVAGVVTGLIVVVAVARVLGRFLLGFRRTARLWVEEDNIYLESTTHLLGREMRRERRSFGPRGLLSVAREVRYPYVYTFLGLLALCLGTLIGTVVYLDGRLAGFEDWMRMGLSFIIGALVLDFLLTVVASTRPGRTTLTLTFAPKTTCRLLGVAEVDADRMLEALTRMANR